MKRAARDDLADTAAMATRLARGHAYGHSAFPVLRRTKICASDASVSAIKRWAKDLGRLARVIALVSVLCGCGGPKPKAPEPAVNPHPHQFTKLKISVEPGARVDSVEVYSIWAIGNIGCAPIHPISGAPVVKQVHVRETTEKVGSHFVAMIIEDRFRLDKCEWHVSGYDVNFMRNRVLLSSGGAGIRDFEKSNLLKLACVSESAQHVLRVCWPGAEAAALRNRFDHVFTAALEIET